MSTELIDLELDEISLVPAGDDPLAKVAIVKRQPEEKEETMSKETEDKVADLEKAVEALQATETTLKAENERLRKALIENEFVIKADTIEKKALEETIEVEGEMVAKSAIPAPVLKALEAAEVAKREAALVEKARATLPNFDEAVAKDFMGMNLSEEMLKALKAADKLFGGMTEEVGKTDIDGDMADPKGKLDALVAKVAAEKNINKYAAYEEIAKTKEGKALINAVHYKKES